MTTPTMQSDETLEDEISLLILDVIEKGGYDVSFKDDREVFATASLIEDLTDRLAALQSKPSEGWRVVPVEPTGQMVEAAIRCVVQENKGLEYAPWQVYKAMLAAAPSPPSQSSWRDIDELHAEIGDQIWGATSKWQRSLRLSDDFRPEDSPQWVDEDGRVWVPTHWKPLPSPPPLHEQE